MCIADLLVRTEADAITLPSPEEGKPLPSVNTNQEQSALSEQEISFLSVKSHWSQMALLLQIA